MDALHWQRGTNDVPRPGSEAQRSFFAAGHQKVGDYRQISGRWATSAAAPVVRLTGEPEYLELALSFWKSGLKLCIV
jgi:hypothetical protein